MKLLDRIRDRVRPRDVYTPNIIRPAAAKVVDEMLRADRERARKTLAQQVLDAPADFNRVTRRSVGLWGRLWKWDTRGTEMERAFLPRYIRRHYGGSVTNEPGGSLTRRQRKARARIIRIMSRTNFA